MISAKVPNEIRSGVYRRDGYACALCGDPRHLQIHHAHHRGNGGGNSPFNLIVLCRYCHAMAHGTNLNTDIWLTQEECEQYAEEVEQACVEYLSDMYAGLWDPFEMLDYGKPEEAEIARLEIKLGCAEQGRR